MISWRSGGARLRVGLGEIGDEALVAARELAQNIGQVVPGIIADIAGRGFPPGRRCPW